MIRNCTIMGLWVILLHAQALFAQQGVITGRLLDSDTQESLPGVSVMLNKGRGTLTDADGYFNFDSLAPGEYLVIFSLQGYHSDSMSMVAYTVHPIPMVLVRLMPLEGLKLDPVVISGSPFHRRLSEETISVDVIQPYLIKNTGARDLSDVLRKSSAVTVTDGQASIRGGSGYSYGAGSRVQVLVDGMPLISAELGDVWWNFVPVELTEQIEVSKGAASVLYGSGASNGTIRVRTGWAHDKPESSVQAWQGLRFDPRRAELKWWRSNERPSESGFMFSHRRKLSEQVDFVTGGYFSNERSYLQGCDRMQGRLSFKTRRSSSTRTGLQYGLNGSLMFNQFGRFVLWQNQNEGAYLPSAGYSSEKYNLLTLDPFVRFVGSKGGLHSFQGRIYDVRKKLDNFEPTHALVNMGKYMYGKSFSDSWSLAAGVEGNAYRVTSYILTVGDSILNLPPTSDGYQRIFSAGGAVFGQLERKKGKLTTQAGFRYEWNQVGSLSQRSGPLLRIGMNYHAAPKLYLRSSFGQGFRFPALAERFLSAELTDGTSGVQLFPNPGLTPERGWNAEVGAKKSFEIGKLRGYADLALFWMEYQNMTEFILTVKDNQIGFINENVGRARIAGYELSTMMESRSGKVPFRIFGGYTFIFPGDLESDTTQRAVGTYLSHFFQSFGGVDSLQNSLLRYRYRHVFQLDAEADLGRLSMGVNLSYNSFMDKIDEVFEWFVPGVKEYRDANAHGSLILGARLQYRPFKGTEFSLIGQNITNTEYSPRAGLMAGPGGIRLQWNQNF